MNYLSIASRAITKHILIMWLCALPSLVYAELVVDKSVIFFDSPLTNKQDIEVSNSDEEQKLYVSVETYEVSSPGTDEEELLSLVGKAVPSFVSTPSKLIINPQASSRVRLLNIDRSGDRERVYRINFLPISRPLELAEEASEDNIRTAIEVLIAYQVLAIVLPENPVSKPVIIREGRKARFANEGNTNYILAKGSQCNPAEPTVCEELPTRRVYAGNDWQIELPFDGPFTYTVRSHGGNYVKRFD